MELPFDPVISLLGTYPKNPEPPIQKNLCAPIFIAVLFIIAKIWKQPKCPLVDEWIKKLWYIYAMAFCNNMDRTGTIMLSEMSQSVKDKYHMISLIRGI